MKKMNMIDETMLENIYGGVDEDFYKHEIYIVTEGDDGDIYPERRGRRVEPPTGEKVVCDVMQYSYSMPFTALKYITDLIKLF